jgi:serine phosphatase RsbU (regulator of sigma subunit)
MRCFKRWLPILLLSILPALVSAFEVTPATPMIFKATASVQMLDDPDSRLTPEQVIARLDDFRPLSAIEKLDRTHSHWLFVTLSSTLDHDRELRIELPAWEETHSFVLNDDGSLRELPVTGAFLGSYSRLVDVNPFKTAIGEARSQYPLFVLESGKPTRLLLRSYRSAVASPASLSPNFIDHVRYLEMRRFGLVIEGIFAGILIAAAVFGCYSALQNRDRTSVFYAAWIIIALISSTILPVHDGSRIYEFLLNFEGIRIGPAYLTRLVGNSFAYLQAIGYVLFARSFLDLKTEMPTVYRATNVYMALSFCHWLLMVPFYHVALTLPPLLTWAPYAVMLIAMLLSIFGCAWIRHRQGLQVAKFFMIAIIPYLFFRITFLLSSFLQVPSPFSFMEMSGIGLFLQNANTAQAVGICSEAVIMGLAVFSKNRWLQEELQLKMQAQAALVANQNLLLETTVTERTRELVASKADTERQHQLVVDSITYASRLQKAQLPRAQRLDQQFRSWQAIWEPRDTIGGDVWWASPADGQGRISIVLADSTGHGVPGAMLSVLISTSLERMYVTQPDLDPAAALLALDQALRIGLNQGGTDAESDDGCDAAIVRIDPHTREIEFAGAKLGLILLRSDGSVERVQPTRISLGYQQKPQQAPQLQSLRCAPGDLLLLITDGITDQIGGEGSPRAYGYKRLCARLERCAGQSASAVAQAIRDDLQQWQGSQMRRDDVTAVVLQLN